MAHIETARKDDDVILSPSPNPSQSRRGGEIADAGRTQSQGARFNHMYTIAFEVKTDHPADRVEEREILAGLLGRIQNVVATQGLIFEAVGGPDDTFEEDS